MNTFAFCRRTFRNISLLLLYAMLLNQFAHAATLPRKLAAWQTTQAPQQPASLPTPAGTNVPALILNAHTIFITNEGTEPNFPALADAAYNQFVADLKAWGRYQIVTSPDQADLILQLRSEAPFGGIDIEHGTGSSYNVPQLRLNIVDPKTKVSLWTLTQPVFQKTSKKDPNDWLSISAMNLTSKVKVLTGSAVTPAENAAITVQPPRNHHKLAITLLIVIPIVLFVGGFLIDRHIANDFKQAHGLTCAQNPFFCTN